MERVVVILSAAIVLAATAHAQTSSRAQPKSVYLEKVSWQEAEKALTPDAVVVIALGGASKEHGPHLPLSSDFIQAEYVKDRVAERTQVVVAPSITYRFYPPFAEYPGSVTLRQTADDLLPRRVRRLRRRVRDRDPTDAIASERERRGIELGHHPAAPADDADPAAIIEHRHHLGEERSADAVHNGVDPRLGSG